MKYSCFGTVYCRVRAFLPGICDCVNRLSLGVLYGHFRVCHCRNYYNGCNFSSFLGLLLFGITTFTGCCSSCRV